MKKIFSCVLALFAAVSLYAADLNIYASGLNATQRGNVAFVDYTLNTQADSIMLMLYGEDINMAMPKVIKEPTYLTAGKHQIQLALPFEFAGTYHWAIKAFASATQLEDAAAAVDNSGKFYYYLPQDVVVDNNFESPYFGRIYVSESTNGASDGASFATKNQTRGLYIYNADLTFVNGDSIALHGFDGGIGGNAGARQGFKRLAIDKDGYVYVASRDAANKGIYRMDPANPAAPFVQIMAATETVDAIEVVGNNLFTIEGIGVNAGTLNKYALANPLGAPIGTFGQDSLIHFVNGDCAARDDHRGGFWMINYRGQLDEYNMVAHLNANGTPDYFLGPNHNDSLITSSYRGTIAVNPAGDKIAISTNGHGVVCSVTYDETTGVPTLTKLYEISTPTNAAGTPGANVDGLAFDAADNFYMLCATRETMQVFPMPKTDNSFVTPAPTNNTVVIEPIGEVNNLYLLGGPNEWNPTIGTQMTKVADKVFNGTFTFTGDVSYFAFSSVLAENNDQGGWDYVNSHRFAGESYDAPAHVGKNYMAKTDLSFSIAPGTYMFTVDLNEMKLTIQELKPMYIAFKDNITANSSDNSSRVEAITDVIKVGAEYVSAFASNDPKNVYNARNGYGLKLGTSSKTGSFTITLADAVYPDSIIVRAAAYSASEGSAVILGDSVNFAQYGNKMITPIVKVYDGATAVTELTISSVKRLYVTDITIYPHGAPIPAPIADRTFGLGATMYLNVDTTELSNVKTWVKAGAIHKAYFVDANGDSIIAQGVVRVNNTKVRFMVPSGTFRYVGFECVASANDSVMAHTSLFDLRGTDSNYIKTWVQAGTGNGYNSVIWDEYVEPIVYKIKHPWDLNNVDPWMWKECEEQIDGTWALEAPYYGGGCNIDPKVLEQDWIASPVLVGNPYNGDSCRFVINPAATDVAGILTITKLGDPNPDTTVVVYDHLYEIGDNQGWKPTEAIEMTKKSENVFEGTFDFTATLSYFAFITVKPETEDWALVNANRFGGAINNELIADGGTYNLNTGELCLTANPGKYTITVNLTEMTAAVTLETGIENINGENNVQKVLRNGQIYIIRDGETYTVTGAKVE
ncbi:MAG: hypothetical protein E7074_01685 [Bacteroidales bacterium]|jgi:hypothetical protein|nr:hypothetical protein [Bacteroidales bacterium]